MTNLQIFKNELFEVGAKIEGEEILFDVEQVAKCLGITQHKSGREYVRWERVNAYLSTASPEVGKGSLIPEPMVYKLAFKASNEVAEQFQDWLAVEIIPQIRKTGSYSLETTQLSPELQMFNHLFTAIANTELKQKEQDERITKVEKEQENISNIIKLNPVEWRKKVTSILNKIGMALGGFEAYRNIKNESYRTLEERAHCNLERRLTNRKKEMALNGVTKSKRDKVSKLDIIADDARLTEIYLAIVKEMAIEYRINVDGLGA